MPDKTKAKKNAKSKKKKRKPTLLVTKKQREKAYRERSRRQVTAAARADAISHQVENPNNLSKSGPTIFGKKVGNRIRF